MLISLRNGMLVGGAAPKVYAVCFENVGSTEGTVGWAKGNYSSARQLDLQYSFDGQSWNSLPISEKPVVPAGRKIYIRAGETGQNNFASDLGVNYAARFQLTGSEFKVSGEMLSLLKQTPITQFTSQNNRAFAYAFYSCDKLVDASQLVMPDFTVNYECYRMFGSCTSLTTAPALPATILANSCYYQIFLGCTVLSSVNVGLTSWNGANSTTQWLNDTASTGTFKCPAALGTNETIERGANRCPNNWTVVNI